MKPQDRADFRVPSTKRPWPFLSTSIQKSLMELLAFLNFQQASVYSSDTVNFRFPWPDWPHPFPPIPTSKKFWSTFNFHAKNQVISGEMVALKILQSDWLRAFWHISQDLPKYGICAGIQQIISAFIIEQIQ